MTRTHSGLAALALLATFAACTSKPASAPRPLPIVEGTYQFSERPARLAEAIEGTVTVAGDTLLVEARPGPCRYDEQASWGKNHPFTFQCAEVTLTFDRMHPVDRASYRTTTLVNERQTVCVRYDTNTAGQRVCVQQETQTIPRQISVSGSLRLTRVANPE
jgi:hypothetical protein